MCGTYADLTNERQAVFGGIRRLQLAHDSMEFFGARDEAPIETCLAEVRRSDVLVAIVGHMYGSLVPGSELSFSETEYREAYRLGKPCLVYLRADNVPVLPSSFETDPAKYGRLLDFKETLKRRHTPAYFRAADDLALQVVADLGRMLQGIEQAANLKSRTKPAEAGSAGVRPRSDRADYRVGAPGN